MVVCSPRPDPERRRAPGGRGRYVALAAALYLAAGLAGTWTGDSPWDTSFAATGASGHGGVSPGDHLQAVYNLWLPGHQLEHGRAPWLDPYSFQPESPEHVNFAAWPLGLAFWPLDALFGTVAAWNLLSLLAVGAAGGLACAWLRALGLPRGAALAGGLAFALAPYRLNQSTEHLLGPISVLLPAALLAFERRRLALCAVALASIPLSGQVHLALGAIPFFALYALVRTRERRTLAWAAGAVAAAILAGLLVRAVSIEGSVVEGGRSLAAVSGYSAGWLDLVSREARHGSERYVFLGWVTLALGLVGLVVLARERRRALAWLLAGAVALPVLFALGTNTPVYKGLWHALPPLQYPRVPGRLMPIACLALAALVAFAVARLRFRLAAAVAVAVVALDLSVFPFAASPADEANRAWAALPPGRVVELPFFKPDLHYGGAYLYYETQAARERPGGYSTVADPAAVRVAAALERLNCGDWTAGAERRLRELGVTAVTVHRPLFVANRFVAHTARFAEWGLERHGWRLTAEAGPVRLYRPGAAAATPPPRSDPVFCQAWRLSLRSGRVMRAEHASLWVHGPGAAELTISAPEPLPTTFAVDGRRRLVQAVSSQRRVTLELGGPGWHLVALTVPRLSREPGRPAGVAVHRVRIVR